MKKLILCIAFFLPFFTKAQTQADLNNAGNLLLNKKYKEALAGFQQIMAGSDAVIKRRAIDFLTETWVDHTNEVYISLSGEIKGYAQLISDYMGANFTGKEAGMNEDDHYTAGMIFWALGSSGARSEINRALSQLSMAYRNGKGNKYAIGYFAEAINAYKQDNPSMPWGTVLEAQSFVLSELKTLSRLKSFGWDKYTRVTGWLAAKTQPERDTARMLFFETLNMTAQIMPDSLYKMIDYYRHRSFNPTDQDTVLTGYLDRYVASMPNTPALRKAIAWNYLYQFFFDLTPKTDDIRSAVMKKIKALYSNDDKAVIEVISTFLNEANVNAAGYAMSLTSKWLQYFSPMQVSDPASFYFATASSDADMTAFISANGPITNYLSSMVKGYQRRLYVLDAIINSGALSVGAKSALGQTATMSNITTLKELLAMPALSKSSDLKHVYADMAVLNNYAYAINFGQVPVQIGDLPKVFAGWTEADKQTYDATYFNKLAAILNKIKTSAPISDLDYSRLTDAMNKLAVVFRK